MTRRTSETLDETTPLLVHHNSEVGERRWSLARRRSSAFLSFLSEPEDKDGDEYAEWQRKRTIFLIVGLTTLYAVGSGITNSFTVELVQTLACAEYYHSSSPDGSPFPTLPSAGDPSELCSVAWVDKRTSQMATYVDSISNLTICIASLILATVILPRFSRRSIGIALPLCNLAFALSIALIPTHYSFDASVPSTSITHPTTSMNLLLLVYIVGGLLGVPTTGFLILAQVMVLDACREDEKTSAFAQVYATNTLGMAISSILLRFVLPNLGINFSILRHTGPFSPYWMVVISYLITTISTALLLPETKPVSARSLSRTASISSDDEHPGHRDGQVAEAQGQSVSSTAEPRSSTAAIWQTIKETLSLFGYLVPYKSPSNNRTDFKLPLILLAVLSSDTITLIWSNLVVFCSTHLNFGPKEVTTLLGIIGASKGLFAILVLPHIVKAVRRVVARKMRQELNVASLGDVSTETRSVKREESVIRTDLIVAAGSLLCDALGFIAMGIAAAHLSAEGIYGSK